MNNWEISAFSWSQQAWEVLEPASSLVLSRSLSSPADSFVGVFHLRWPLPALAFLNIHQNDKLLFEGMVDTQRTFAPASKEQMDGLALTYAKEALAPMPDVVVTQASCRYLPSSDTLEVALTLQVEDTSHSLIL